MNSRRISGLSDSSQSGASDGPWLLLLIGLLWGLPAANVAAMPLGRAWAPIDTLKVNGHAYMAPSRFEPVRDGRIELLGTGYYGNPGIRNEYGLVWSDSSWQTRWTFPVEGYRIWPTHTPPDRQMLVWKGTQPLPANQYRCYLMTADVVGKAVSEPETVAVVSSLVLVYSGSSWGGRRWVAVRDESPKQLRLFLSDRPRQWREISGHGLNAGGGPQIAALDSVNALVLSGEWFGGIQWGVLRDTVLELSASPIMNRFNVAWPTLRPRKSGGFWTAWFQGSDSSDVLMVRRFDSDRWAPAETLQVRQPGPWQYTFGQAEMGAEGSDIPAMAWFGYTYQGDDAAYYVWASFPTDSGFGVGERVEGSWNGINPTLVRDENEDVWLAWWRQFDGIYWTHSRTTVSASAPAVSESAGRPVLTWRLSGAAPGTWWAVMRATEDGELQRVARIRATPDSMMRWVDEQAPANNRLRYAIRRECRDVRYQEVSAEAEWVPRGLTLRFQLKGQNPAPTTVRGDLLGASAGSVHVALFDLQGREVSKRVFTARGSGRDAIELDLPAALRSGVYLLRATAADGRGSPGTKFVILR